MSLPKPRVVFFGTGEIGLPSLDFLLTGITPACAQTENPALPPAEVIGIVTGPDRPAGRGLRVRLNGFTQRARAANIPCLQPLSLRNPEVQIQLKNWEAEFFIVMAYGKLLPSAVLDFPPRGAWNLHASLLPRHRGASPIQSAILAGDSHTGISLMRMEEGLDTGPVLWQESLAIQPQDTGGSLHDKLALLAAQTLKNAWHLLVNPAHQPRPQDSSLATYATKIEKTEGRIDWKEPADILARRVRAFTPWPGCSTLLPRPGSAPLDLLDLKIWQADVVHTDLPLAAPGTVVKASPDGLEVATGKGVLRILECQLPGKKRLPVADFLRGFGLSEGLVLGVN